METRTRLHGIVLFLLSALMGCSTTRQVHLPGEIVVPDDGEKKIFVVEIGDYATLYLKSGDSVQGEVVGVDLHQVVLGNPGNYGYREETYYSSEIERIEAGRSTEVGRFGGGVVVGVTVAFILLTIAVGLSGGLVQSGG